MTLTGQVLYLQVNIFKILYIVFNLSLADKQQIQNSKFKIQNSKFKIQIPNSKFQDPNSRFKIPRFKNICAFVATFPDPKSQIPNPKSQIPNPKFQRQKQKTKKKHSFPNQVAKT